MAEKDRLRIKQINIRLTDAEYQYLHDKASSCELTMSDYIRKVITDGFVIKYQSFDIKELSRELNKIGVNINQIAHHINANGGEYERQDLDNLISEFSEMESVIFKHVWGLE